MIIRPFGIDRLNLQEPFAAVILDVMLPGLDGFKALRELRARSRIPVLMLTGRGEEPDRIVGLELGADDYLPKTFSTRELLARLRSVIRRSVQTNSQTSPETRRVVVGELQLDCNARVAFMGTEPLQPTATELICCFRSQNRVAVSRVASNCCSMWRTGISMCSIVPWMCTSPRCARS
ncbi:MAG TPA: response regulator transcription factor [Bryobacteraceae bacterium]|nr:response regulator transcription factor [Bryobacteraceae bacterium]